MMSLTLALAVTACGGSDTETDTADTAVEETVDDTAEANEAEAEDVAAEDATEESEEDLGPLYSIEAAVAPDVAGTTWHFVGAMLDGEELDAETATGVLDQNYGGTLDMVFDEDGNLYVSDRDNNCIRKITPDGNVTIYAGNRSEGLVNGLPLKSSFRRPEGLTRSKDGVIYVADHDNHVIRKIVVE